MQKKSPARLGCLLLAAMALCAGSVTAQQFPNRPIRVIVGFPPGGPVDDQARVIGQKFPQALGQPLVIDNRPGADGILAADLTAKAAPDGHTLMIASIGFTTTPSLHAKLPYDPLKDFAPIIQNTASVSTLAVNPSVPARTIAELIALAKAQPGKLNYGSVGIGSSPHLSSEMFAGMAGIKLTHIPYKGAAPAMTDLLSGQIQIIVGPLSASFPHIRAGKVRALGVTNSQRSPLIPDVPTIGETLPGFVVTSWYGFIAPGRTPTAVIELLNSEVGKILAARDVGDSLSAKGMDPVGGSVQAFATLITTEIQKWGKVARDAGIRPE